VQAEAEVQEIARSALAFLPSTLGELCTDQELPFQLSARVLVAWGM
jgi:hypothetical protein